MDCDPQSDISYDSIQPIGYLPFIFFACPKKTKQKKRHQRKKSFWLIVFGIF